MKRINVYTITISLLISVVLSGCKGGSDKDQQTSDSEPEIITGTVSAPAGVVALYQQPSLLDYLLPSPAYAAVAGLDPVANGSISLIRVGDDGLQVGDVLATALTSATGAYELSLPQGVGFSSSLVLKITGQTGQVMRAQVVSNQTDLNPISEYVTQKTLAHGGDLSLFSLAYILQLLEVVNATNFTNAGSVSLILDQIESTVGPYVEQHLSEYTTGEILSTHRAMSFGLGLQDQTSNSEFGYYSELYRENIDLTVPQAGNNQWRFSNKSLVWGMLVGQDTANLNEYSLPVGAVSDNNSTLLYETPLASGSFSINWGTQVEIRNELGWETAPRTITYNKVPDSELYFSAGIKDAKNYQLNNNAIDYGSMSGYGFSYELSALAKMPTAMTLSDLDGEYGLVEIDVGLLNNGTAEITSSRQVITFNGSNYVHWGQETNGNHNTRYGNQDNEESEIYGNFPQSLEFSVSANGTIDIAGVGSAIGGPDMKGFVSDDSRFIALMEYAAVNEAMLGNKLGLAVKLSDSSPTLNNSSYRLLFLHNEFYDRTKIKLAKNGQDASISWVDQDNATINYRSESMSVSGLGAFDKLDNSPIDESVSVLETLISDTHQVTIKANVDGDTYELIGYFNDTGSVGVFNAGITNDAIGDMDEIGIAILVKQ
ncbi:hypothetical protein [Vibrio fluminensis]|uniref:hypothetical protein n=1 Tax=Vibrio fluminensis TaxID=2783614 RepID=UPI0018873CFA|nr:hypothetical protein [Vibrio fluminensis]